MALGTINGFSVEEATSKYVLQNMIGGLAHINGKGVTDKFTLEKDVRSVMKVDVMRLKAVFPQVRQVGAANNGDYINKFNTPAQGNSPQSVNYSIDVNLFYDRLIPIGAAQLFANKTEFEKIVQLEVIDTMNWAINIVTFAKQIERFFSNGDNFDKALAHQKGSVVAADITAGEIANALFQYDPTVMNDCVKKFIKANNKLNSILELGQYRVPVNERQAFISPDLYADMMSQFASNASQAAAQINATGYINPFTQAENIKIDVERSGLCGMYNGIPMTQLYDADRELIYIYLGIKGTENDADATLTACRGHLDKLAGFIVAGAGTCRGIAIAPTIKVAEDPYNAQMVNICPLMKMGVDVLHGASMKFLIDAGASLANALTASDIADLVNTLTFTAIGDDGVLARAAVPEFGFNDGTTK